ncbi:hypothetical protein [Oricola sp.]|uniref:hypothetical protein n=1 Tax=Oricola sp. TaxID=1979950 RepID=UPI0025FE8E88|nr:hypothetical protein [Oricola sp.]MCI5077239.1 hypothetical protein [Oricola sp.]
MSADFFGMTTLAASGVTEADPTGAAALHRTKVLEMTQAAEDAVLAPSGAGAWSADIRAALATRIATLNGETALAERYAARIGDDSAAALADPANDGSAQNMSAAVAFMDKVAARTRDVKAEDIETLKAAGIDDADIVRLAELNAFLAYQIRLVAGLKLMRGAA